jgi:hypothetical protein
VGEIKVGIDLGGGDVGVAEQLLDAAQILTRFKKMRRERMPEQVGVDLGRQTLAARPVADAQLHGAVLEPAAITANEHRGFFRRRQCRAFLQPGAQRFFGLASHGHDALLAPFAEHADRAIRQVELAEVQRDQLIEPQSRGIEQLHDGLVAHGEHVVGRDVQQLADLVHVQRAGQALRGLGRAHVQRRIAADHAFAQQEIEKAAHRRDAPLHAARVQSAGMRACREHAHVLAVEDLPVGDAALLGEVGQRAQVARVVGRGMRRESPLLGKMREVGVYLMTIRACQALTRHVGNGAGAAPSVSIFH